MNPSIPLRPSVGQPDHPNAVTAREIDSGELFQAAQEVVIRHDGHAYRLRITRQNKLILTK